MFIVVILDHDVLHSFRDLLRAIRVVLARLVAYDPAEI